MADDWPLISNCIEDAQPLVKYLKTHSIILLIKLWRGNKAGRVTVRGSQLF